MVFFSLRTRNATSRAHAPSLRDFPTRTPAWPPSGASYRIGVHYVRDVLVPYLEADRLLRAGKLYDPAPRHDPAVPWPIPAWGQSRPNRPYLITHWCHSKRAVNQKWYRLLLPPHGMDLCISPSLPRRIRYRSEVFKVSLRSHRSWHRAATFFRGGRHHAVDQPQTARLARILPTSSNAPTRARKLPSCAPTPSMPASVQPIRHCRKGPAARPLQSLDLFALVAPLIHTIRKTKELFRRLWGWSSS